jgi:hypothetical protein
MAEPTKSLDIQTASFVLKTTDIGAVNGTAAVQTTTGYRDAIGSKNIWYRCNLPMMLGDMWFKYKKFNLYLRSVSTGYCTVAPQAAASTCNTYIAMKGLTWTDNYKVANKSNSMEAILTTFYMPSAIGAGNQLHLCDEVCATFTVDNYNPFVDLEINFYDMATDANLAGSAANYCPHFFLVFDILPVG